MMSADLTKEYKLFIEGLEEEVKDRSPALLRSSPYRDVILEMVDTLRTKGYKYKQSFLGLGCGNKACAFGVFNKEKNGNFGGYDSRIVWTEHRCNLVDCVGCTLNDRYHWTFDQIADELERGVSIIQ